MARTNNPLFTTVMLLHDLMQFPNGVTSKDFSGFVGRNLSGRLSKLHDYGVIDRVLRPNRRHGDAKKYLYRTKLPKVTAPPAADVESSSVASQPAEVE